MNKKKIEILITRFLSGEATEHESKQLEDWLAKSEKNRKEFARIETIWQKISPSQPEEIPSFDSFWADLEGQLSKDSSLASRKEKSFRNPFAGLLEPFFTRPIGAFATSVVLLIIIGIALLNYFAEDPILFITSQDEKITLTLPDNSSVKLNSNTTVSYNEKDFPEERIINLDGQAFFRVSHNGLPFKVKTKNAVVEVLGTSFDVSYRNDKTALIVASGKVLFKSQKNPDDSGVILTKAQMSTCSNDEFPTTPISVSSESLISWINEKLIFNNSPMSEVAEVLNKTFTSKIILYSNVGKLKLTGEFEQQSLKEIIELICKALELDYKFENNSYVIFKNNE
ncbi:MAG: FecR family protein [Ignavibacteria bacterium]